ncbi:MAG: pyruvate dehydrogenase (acetyl-transferring) E1 component subunit alpha [Methanomassiliicoccus sp.]|nr:pyruvate dehydrogenase (acetyl-transferring) E1 component subunit alpha [Methanomassiliicoccus sp.]
MLTDDYDPLRGRMLQVLDQDGQIVEPSLEPKLDADMLERAYRTMVLSRVADEKAVILQRQGRLGAYPPNRGQEAASLGPAMALDRDDWLVWAFRELAGLLWKGLPLLSFYLYWMGNEEGSHYPQGLNITPAAVPVASQLSIAVGIAYASMCRREGRVALGFCGDGATSEGDFHEALNSAGVLRTPNVFVIQNNQWAISVPRSRQTAAPTLAQKACAYGFKGIQVDGNDLLAMYIATREAVERARRGEGPTLIEAYTYRLGNHTTSDDARKYRQEQELREWELRDPLVRLKTYMTAKDLLDESKEQEIWKAARDATDKGVKEAESFPKPALEDIFRYTYEEMPAELKAELERLRSELQDGER